MIEENLDININADISGFRTQLYEADKLAQRFGTAFSTALEQATIKGRGLETVIQSLGKRLSKLAVDTAFQPVEKGIAGLFQSLISGSTNGLKLTPFAKGGVINSPQLFANGGGLGLAGEAGAEAILPLARGSDGRLGVRAQGQAKQPQINVTIQTQDINSFHKSQASVTRAMAQAFNRSQRYT